MLPAGRNSSCLQSRDTSKSPLNVSSHAPVQTFSSILVEHFRSIIEKTSKDLQFVNDTPYNVETKTKFQQVLDQGIWYSRDYHNALLKCDNQAKMTWLHKDQKRPIFASGFLSEKHFSLKERNVTFQIRKQVLPSLALDSVGIECCLLDCGSIYSLAFFRALKQFIGTDKFDHLFAYDSPTPLILSPDLNWAGISCLFSMEIIDTSDEIQEGDKCYFCNIPNYQIKHPTGNASGYTVVCTNNQEKPFLGFGLPPEGISKEGVELALLDSYNQSVQFPVEARGPLANHTLTLDEFKHTEGSSISPKDGKLCLKVIRPITDYIELIANVPLASVRELFADMVRDNK